MSSYIPGVCNIGIKERNQRLTLGIVSLIVLLLFVTYLSISTVPAYYKIFVFAPAYGASIGFLQYFMKFCAAFGILGKYNFDRKLSVTEKEFLKKDRNKALLILVYSLLISFVLTMLVFLI